MRRCWCWCFYHLGACLPSNRLLACMAIRYVHWNWMYLFRNVSVHQIFGRADQCTLQRRRERERKTKHMWTVFKHSGLSNSHAFLIVRTPIAGLFENERLYNIMRCDRFVIWLTAGSAAGCERRTVERANAPDSPEGHDEQEHKRAAEWCGLHQLWCQSKAEQWRRLCFAICAC